MILSSRRSTKLTERQMEIVLDALAEMQVDLLDLDIDDLNAARQEMVMTLDAIIEILMAVK